MNERDAVSEAASQIAAAIGRRDLGTIRKMLAPGFVQRTHGGSAVDGEAFLSAIEQIPGQILLVELERVEVDVSPAGALVTGIQHAKVAVDGQTIEERRAFVDWFAKHAGEWRIQAAVDLPEPVSS